MAARSELTSLSAGLLIYEWLTTDEAVMAIANKVFPVISEEGAQLPYICYRRASQESTLIKGVAPGPDAVSVEIVCYAANYPQSVALAEAVRKAMEGYQYDYQDGEGNTLLVAKSCVLSDAEEGWADDAYAQNLIFTLKL